MTDLAHLHSHSYYSLMDGLNSPGELLAAAKDMGQTSMAVTDHGTLSAHREFQREAKALGIKPILGLEAYISPTDRFDKRSVKAREDNTALYNHLIILAKNEAGLKNLHQLSEAAWNEGYYYKPRIDFELLEQHRDGLVILSGCRGGLIAKAVEAENFEEAENWARKFKDAFDTDFYMELQVHNPLEMNQKMLEIADLFSIKPIVTADCHYARAEDLWVEEAMLILSTSPKKNPGADLAHSRKMHDIYERLNYLYPDRPMSFQDLELYVTSRQTLEEGFVAQGITRTDLYESTIEVADKIGDYEYNEGLALLPVPKGNPDKKLREMVMKGLKARGHADDPIYVARANEELTVISEMKFPSYFLIVAELVEWSKKQGILVGPGRGSAAGSVCVYALGITDVDPIFHGLLFGRFINVERNDYPDIDIDFADKRRKEVKEHLVEKFGNVASISTFGTFADKGVVRDAARVFGIPLAEVNAVLKLVETFEEFQSSNLTAAFRTEYPEVADLARRLRGRIRSVGLHPAGVVIANQPISNIAPIETRKDPQSNIDERLPVVAWDMVEAEGVGLIKMDLLGLKTLSVISDTVAAIKQRHGKTIDPVKIDLTDPLIYRDLSNGFTRGIFQAEARPYTALLMEMGVSDFNDLAASNALVRPGAMKTVGSKYIARKQGREQVRYLHPIMEVITQNTYGLVIYQEQVMQTCVALAGMTWAEADKIRKIIGKKRDVAEFDQWRDKFVSGASENISEDAATTLWHEFEAHAGYSFNLSHAVAYSMITYWTAWLKHYYPLEFMWAVLCNEGKKELLTGYLIEAKRLKIKVLLPHINESSENFSIQGDAIRFGLSSVKYVGVSAPRIIREAPYNSYAQVLDIALQRGSGINTRVLGALNKVGAASFHDNPLVGDESSNYYEYLNIPKFDSSKVPAKALRQMQYCEDFEERGVYMLMAMVQKVTRGTGKGWSRVEIVDETGSVGVFHNEATLIEPGNMYVFLIGDNRIHRYVNVNDIAERQDDSFIQYLKMDEIPILDSQYYVVDFTNYKTKAGKMMGHLIVSNKNKEMKRVLVFPKQYGLALSKMKPGSACTISLSTMDDKALAVKEIK